MFLPKPNYILHPISALNNNKEKAMKKHILSFMAASILTISSISSAYAATQEQPSEKPSHIKSTGDSHDPQRQYTHHHGDKAKARNEMITRIEQLNLSDQQRNELDKEMKVHRQEMLKGKRKFSKHHKSSRCLHRHQNPASDQPVVTHFAVVPDAPQECDQQKPSSATHDSEEFKEAKQMIEAEQARHHAAAQKILTEKQFAQFLEFMTPHPQLVTQDTTQ